MNDSAARSQSRSRVRARAASPSDAQPVGPKRITPFEAAKLAKQVETLSRQIENTDAVVENQTHELAVASTTISELSSTVRALRKHIARLEESNSSGAGGAVASESLRSQLDQQRRQGQDLQSQLAPLRVLHSAVASHLLNAQLKIKALNAQVRSANDELCALQQAHAALAEENRQLHKQTDMAQARDAAYTTLLAEHAALLERMSELELGAENATLGAMARRADAFRNQLHLELEAKDDVISELELKLASAQRIRARFELALNEQAIEADTERQKLSQATKLIRNLESQNAQLRDPGMQAPMGRVALLFTDVQGSTRLWAADPENMSEALWAHNTVIRECLAEWQGYEVKTEGDAFMVAFADPRDAVACALRIQSALLDIAWSPKLLESDDAAEDYDADGVLVYCGFRVRMGIHIGEPVTRRDPTHHRMDYFGSVVNLAARVESKAQGGQVLISEETLAAIRPMDDLTIGMPAPLLPAGSSSAGGTHDVLDHAHIVPLGATELKGIPHPVTLFQVAANELAGRIFTAWGAMNDEDPSPPVELMTPEVDSIALSVVVPSGSSHTLALPTACSHSELLPTEAALVPSQIQASLTAAEARIQDLEDELERTQVVKQGTSARLVDLTQEAKDTRESTAELQERLVVAERARAKAAARGEILESQLANASDDARHDAEMAKTRIAALEGSLEESKVSLQQASDAHAAAAAEAVSLGVQLEDVRRQARMQVERLELEVERCRRRESQLTDELAVARTDADRRADEYRTRELAWQADLDELRTTERACRIAAEDLAHNVEAKLRRTEAALSSAEQRRDELEASSHKLLETQWMMAAKDRELEFKLNELVTKDRKLKELMQELGTNEQALSDARRELADAKRKLASNEQSLADARRELADAKRELAHNEQALADFRREFDDTRQELSTRDQALADSRRELDDTRQKLSTRDQALADSRRELDDTRQEFQARTRELAWQADLDELRTTERACRIAAEDLAHNVEAKLRRTEAALSSAEQRRDELEASSHKLLETQWMMAAKDRELEFKLNELVTKDRKLKELMQELGTNEQALSDARRELADAKRKLASNEQSLADARRELADAKRELAHNEQALADFRREFDDTRQELSTRDQALADSRRELDDTRQELSTSDQALADSRRELDDAKRELTAKEQTLAGVRSELVLAMDMNLQLEADAWQAPPPENELAINAANERASQAEAELALCQNELAKARKAQMSLTVDDKSQSALQSTISALSNSLALLQNQLASASAAETAARRSEAAARAAEHDARKEASDARQELKLVRQNMLAAEALGESRAACATGELEDEIKLLRAERTWLLDELEIARVKAGLPL
ncbi:adenylate/guanylate cyclase [Thecamonas trahens ATCC 50062]|uniref:Adenylate/guanylate cyclase n=1 Tax=Thecamonas trahens ATCC 50062 TaxID=461836 RepID=A0A0L0DN95_THETB|nr:adenylate/guanylate cyclase [Thecamonas trahens ATCC 50062]KNC53784.1 adenylate/guanylate cyclase [Thecamonas trahens ATCC 50062]|eukprot:XP_013754346.1 adenylate/guanylate cyclase [Thecamonas trahens ATCC 50062]